MILSIDIGNTFTDFVLLDDQGIRALKILSTPHAPEETIARGIHALNINERLQCDDLLITHNGSETASAFLTKQGANVFFNNPAPTSSINFFNAVMKQPMLLTFNMGDTLTSVSLAEHSIVADQKLLINLGGKSIAYLDDDHQLQLNPPSIKKNNSPACYGLGDDQPTLTDANLILGRLQPNTIIGDAIRVDINAARMAMAKLSGSLNINLEEVALATINYAHEKIISSLEDFLHQRSCDPTQITLCATGGCGGLHVCAIADAMNIRNAIVPVCSGVFSAFNMLASVSSDLHLPTLNHQRNRATHYRTQLYGITLPVSVWKRSELSPEEMIMGPAIITESTTTTFIQNGWLAYVDVIGNLLLRRMAIDVY